MQRIQTAALALIMVATLGWVRSADGQAPIAEAKTQKGLVGTWKLVTAKYGGQDFQFPAGVTTLKHVTPSHFMWVSHDEDGKMTRSAGGRYTQKGDVYEEVPEYGLSKDFDTIKGKPQVFKWKVEGNKWHHDGKLSNGLTIEEVWERLEAK